MNQHLRSSLRDKARASPLLAVFITTLVITAALNPAKLGLAVWGVAKLGMGGYVGYWIDRLIFPYARPHQLIGIEAGTSWKRRALIVAAAVVASALTP